MKWSLNKVKKFAETFVWRGVSLFCVLFIVGVFVLLIVKAIFPDVTIVALFD